MFKGIDVSHHNKAIDWDAVKPQIDFAIIRCGYGYDLESQDDEQFKRNVSECERLSIPYGVYFYSYARTDEMVASEIAHTLRLLENCNPFAVFYDMEESKTATLGKETLTGFAEQYCNAIAEKGFKVGVYANTNWFTNYLDVNKLRDNGYLIWKADYRDNPDTAIKCDIWQYTSKGKIDGIDGNVDMDYGYFELPKVSPVVIPVETPAPVVAPQQVSKFNKGDKVVVNDAINYDNGKPFKLYYNQYDVISANGKRVVIGIGSTVTGAINEDNISLVGSNPVPAPAEPQKVSTDVFYRVQTLQRGWLPEVRNDDTEYAGIRGQTITGVAMRVTHGSIKCRVHSAGKWLPWVTECNISDSYVGVGYAGYGKPIDSIEIYYYTPKGEIIQCANYCVSPVNRDFYSVQIDSRTDNGYGGYAGCIGKPIDRLQIVIK